MVAVVTIGFVKDAVYHIDVQGFNVYHKNRLIKVEFFIFFSEIAHLTVKIHMNDKPGLISIRELGT